MTASDDYSADSIMVLEGLEAVRKRPGMYVGDTTDGSGVHHLVWEVLGNSIDEHLAGHAHRVDVTLEGTTVTVDDDGRGIPVAVHPRLGTPALELILTRLHAGATFDGHTPHVHIGHSLVGVGLAAVNALCEHLQATVYRDERRFEIVCRRGNVVSPLRDCGPADRRGTRIVFRPDSEIFSGPMLDPAKIREYLQTLAYFNPTLTLTFDGEVFAESRGLASMVESVVRAGGAEPPPVVRLSGKVDAVEIDLAMTWCDEVEAGVRSFVCQRVTEEGGTHVEGLHEGLADAVRAMWPRGEGDSAGREPQRGLVAALHIGLYDPCYGGPTKARLASGEAQQAVRRFVAEAVPAWLGEHPEYRRVLRGRLGVPPES